MVFEKPPQVVLWMTARRPERVQEAVRWRLSQAELQMKGKEAPRS